MRHEVGFAMVLLGLIGDCWAVATLVRGEAAVDEG